MEDKIYYEVQDNCTEDKYYYLHRCLHRILFYYKKFSEEIRLFDLSKMTTEMREKKF